MNCNPILIVSGEPNSIFLEIFFKVISKYKFNSPIILISSKKLLNLQIKKLGCRKKIRLLRITMQSDNYYFPRISIGPQRATITFMMFSETNKIVQLKENVSFVMDLCYI